MSKIVEVTDQEIQAATLYLDIALKQVGLADNKSHARNILHLADKLDNAEEKPFSTPDE